MRTLGAALALSLLAGGPAVAAVDLDTAPSVRADIDRKADALLARPVLTSPTTVTMSSGTSYVSLDPSRDYVLKLKAGTVFRKDLTVVGGRNVVFEDAVMTYARPVDAPADWRARGLFLKDQTGVAWLRNIAIRGPLEEGIDLSQRFGASVVLQQVAVDLVVGSEAGHHADVLQTWAGPGRLVVDGLTGSSTFQGIFLQPDDTWDGPPPEFVVLRNVSLDTSRGVYALFNDSYGRWPVVTSNVSVRYNPARPSRDQWLWPKPSTGDTSWSGVVGLR